MKVTCYQACADAMGSSFKEGMKVLDYGCGFGDFGWYMENQLKDFTYYGVEPHGRYGDSCLSKAKDNHGDNPRMSFGYIGEDLEAKAIEDVNVALLLSIFTHLGIDRTEQIMMKLLPIVERGGIIVFTMIHGPEYRIVGPKVYNASAYSVVYNTKEQVNSMAVRHGIAIEKQGEWPHKWKYLHSIYKVSQ